MMVQQTSQQEREIHQVHLLHKETTVEQVAVPLVTQAAVEVEQVSQAVQVKVAMFLVLVVQVVLVLMLILLGYQLSV
jgi:hypothetical protein